MDNGDDKRQGAKRLAEYLPLDDDQRSHALSLQQKEEAEGRRRRIGEILIDERVVDEQTLQAALHAQRLDRLRASHLFKHIQSEEIGAIIPWITETSLAPGELLMRQDDPGDCFYILASGRLLVYPPRSVRGKTPIWPRWNPGNPSARWDISPTGAGPPPFRPRFPRS